MILVLFESGFGGLFSCIWNQLLPVSIVANVKFITSSIMVQSVKAKSCDNCDIRNLSNIFLLMWFE